MNGRLPDVNPPWESIVVYIECLHLLTRKYGVKYIHTYHSRFIPEWLAEVSQISLQDTHVLPKLVSYEEHWW
jgi:hypothetical protein